MAYPPSDWTLNASSCNMVEYERTFSWSELTSCADAGGSALITVSETADYVLLEGTFYVELVSPYSMSSDEYSRSYPLIQQDFEIALLRTINVIASTGTQLFIPSVMGYGRSEVTSDGEGEHGNYQLTILVQSADYVQLGMDNAVTAISLPEGVAVTDIQTVTTGCLVAASFTCGQIFTISMTAECSADDLTADLGGNYQFGFSPQCRTLDDGSTDPACDTFMDSLDGGDVVLEVDSSFVDDCSTNSWEVAFEGDLAFYLDDAFTVEVDDESDPFVIGQDTIYGKVTVDIPDDAYDGFAIMEVLVENVYVCTAVDDLSSSLDSDSGIGGCFSSLIDADGPYIVVGSGAVAKYEGNTTYDVVGSNEAAFSFLTFATPRETIYVHVQALLDMVESDSGEARRRRVLLQSAEGNQFRSYIDTASVQEAETTDAPLETDGATGYAVGFVPALIAFIAMTMMA